MKTETSIQCTETINRLCEFMRNISIENEPQDTKKLLNWYLDTFETEMNQFVIDEKDRLELWDVVLYYSMSLMKDSSLLSTFANDFIMKCLDKAGVEGIINLMSVILWTANKVKDYSFLEKLVVKSADNNQFITKLFWSLIVETERDAQNSVGQIASYYVGTDPKRYYAQCLHELMSSIPHGTPIRISLRNQGSLIEKLVSISGKLRQSRKSVVDKKVELRKELGKLVQQIEDFDLPFTIGSQLDRLIIDQCSVFNSQLNPILLTFRLKSGKLFKCIFKSGDDLRQDTIALSLIRISKFILKFNGQNVSNFIDYEVVPTGLEHGFVEFIESSSLDNILKKERSLQDLFTKRNGTIDETKMWNFVDSLAFYSVITFLLCVGDRHLDNVLLTKDGHIFHVDYGFIGREPKPFAPLVKLCPEMVDLMGGKFSGYYLSFMKRCVRNYMILRKNHQVILNVLKLSQDSGLQDLNEATFDKIKGRFALNELDQNAINSLTYTIESGFELVLPKMMDNFHHTWKLVNSGTLFLNDSRSSGSEDDFEDLEIPSEDPNELSDVEYLEL